MRMQPWPEASTHSTPIGNKLWSIGKEVLPPYMLKITWQQMWTCASRTEP